MEKNLAEKLQVMSRNSVAICKSDLLKHIGRIIVVDFCEIGVVIVPLFKRLQELIPGTIKLLVAILKQSKQVFLQVFSRLEEVMIDIMLRNDLDFLLSHY